MRLRGEIMKYRDYEITRASADAMAYIGAEYEFVHSDYDGDGDNRHGFAITLEEAISIIDDIEESLIHEQVKG